MPWDGNDHDSTLEDLMSRTLAKDIEVQPIGSCGALDLSNELLSFHAR
jgi:hypothetical protein